MTPRDYKVLENRLRRAATRQGLRLEKSRVRDPRAIGYGSYQLLDNRTNSIVGSGLLDGYGLGLDDVARFLFEVRSARPRGFRNNSRAFVGNSSDNTIHVYYGPYHAVLEWLDSSNPNREPFLYYRQRNTTGARVKGRLIPDGWVLNYGGGDEWIVGAWDPDSVDRALAKAKEYLRRDRFEAD